MTYYIQQWLFCLKQYALMCVFASGPQRLPHSVACIAVSTFAYFLIGFALTNELRGYGMVAFQILLELALLSLVAYVGLRWKGMLNRFTQTCSALVGINLIVSAVTIPFFHLFSDDTSSTDIVDSKILLATMLLVFWNLAVLSQILKQAFETNTVMSAMIAFNYFLVYQFIVVWIT